MYIGINTDKFDHQNIVINEWFYFFENIKESDKFKFGYDLWRNTILDKDQFYYVFWQMCILQIGISLKKNIKCAFSFY